VDRAAAGSPAIYDGNCRAENRKHGPGVIRFKIPNEKIAFRDLIRGDVSFDGALIGDVIIAKDIESPFYNLAVVIDDYEMKISHVIRGEEHLGNTPKQLFFHRALGLSPPIYAHLPLLLNKNRAKLSKRDATTVGIDAYIRAGYLPSAIINFIALLGWHPKDNQELLTREELTTKFDLERAQKAGAIFDIAKLAWLNSAYIRIIDDATLRETLTVRDEKNKKIFDRLDEVQQLKLVHATKERIKTLNDFAKETRGLITVGEYNATLLLWKTTPRDVIQKNLEATRTLLNNITADNFTRENLEATVKTFAEEHGRGEVLWPLRAALSGMERSPGPFEIMDIIGKAQSLQRIDAAIEKLTTTTLSS
jgi:glutamyl-tRNA synthetase